MIKKLVPTWRFLKQTSPEKYGTGFVGLAKNFWGEGSEVALATCLGIFSLTGIYLYHLEDNKTGYSINKAYKDHYTVYRPDDPRIARIKEGRIKKLVPTWRFLKQTSPEKYGTGIVGLAKNFWGECSEVALATALGIFSVTGIYLYHLDDNKTGHSMNKA